MACLVGMAICISFMTVIEERYFYLTFAVLIGALFNQACSRLELYNVARTRRSTVKVWHGDQSAMQQTLVEL